ncbi:MULTISPECIES: cupin domain-containing protein [unclassified Rhizobium]|uniref:cupin domain-containing protein n=1 Tax=unclassified Rhizobium TaxID=2613769 RepID=UPI00161B7001|nr:MULTISPECIES: cupin domain-containing protein [unclassified Rhizobium]MBB3290422.1 quercetin dioxygenase-like cupin family protein [Rhizobium sp. BK252]MBB3405260.1 quercetin dioxygenase-like cupin family protein [Rhizobium sp. BK289]MBB3417749.1 quercetin dioxygenase-like cupin family protein [Rhizobium sp. BK284]MBB3485628.1 quercetin dioxygenase-like cupin family protein [Rhizobium sp. BK347]
MKMNNLLSAAFAALSCIMILPVSAHDPQSETVTPKFREAIPNVPGKSLVAVEVDYEPGAASKPHTHAKSAFIYAYVLSGRVESKVNDGPARIYKAGEGWSEPPGAVHSISRNASQTEPARLLAIFVTDTSETKLTFPVKQN